MDAAALGQRLRARRRELDLTLAQVAQRAGLSLPYISNLERGQGNPTYDALQAVAQALETTMAELVGDAAAGSPPVDVLADAPASLMRFSRTKPFHDAVERLAAEQSVAPVEMRHRLLVAMTQAPRRSAGEPTEYDWRRLLDVYRLILSEA